MSMTQRQVPFGRPNIGDSERAAVVAVLSGPILTHGPKGQEFERRFADYTGTAQAVTTSNCTTALHLALLALDIGAGDEVIVPAMTHVATAHAAEHCLAKPVFVDVDPNTGNIDPARVAQAITAKTRAIMVVHYVGLPCDMAAIQAIAKDKGIPVVEDCAAALGGTFAGQHVGSFGAAGCFSFYPTKHITTMEGGMLVSNDVVLAERVRKQRAFGYSKGLDERKVPGVYDVDILGHNFRMSEASSAIGVCQMDRLPDFLARRHDNAAVLRAGLAECEGLTVLPARYGDAVSADFCVNVVLDDGVRIDRDALLLALQEAGVGTSVHYPVALPLSVYYAKRYGGRHEDFPVANRLATRGLSLPCAPHVKSDDAAYIVERFTSLYKAMR